MRSDKIIRVGDLVIINSPNFFVRCGYPMCIKEEVVKMQEEFGEDVAKLFRNVGIQESSRYIFENQSYQKVCKELAYAKCRSENFGGRERKVYTKEDTTYHGKECEVVEVSFVKTGKYVPASYYSSWGWDSDAEYEPAELVNQKTHKILTVCFPKFVEKKIEAVHVEKV